MEQFSGAVLKKEGAGTHRIVAARRDYSANNPDHARILLEAEIPGRPTVVLTVALTPARLTQEVYEDLQNAVLERLAEAGLTEIEPERLALTVANVRKGDAYESYLLAVAPVER
ncbi:hypothetical protein Ocepr_2282 (plasmid) [Oceanithermus profundus DSM 14977]|uniref:Uncharacterized protein n=1 Tax=Oceanithermus profundus (strain DSM 14977 / NBRC 100410 / VKM B-2274 / 506) TaxID=670487 RepID=E4UAU5_OCEP5|nr:hypothetical protein [Oceanithermus profundus]ADR37730.1 hypothetical protein Ocepr_2282 [Oceanithermus profundus DSM 14977]